MFEFSIFRIPVRVEPMFLLTMGFLGYMMAPKDGGNSQILLVSIALFILLAFISIMLHELGHALTGRRFTNSPVEIVLESFGGHARFSAPRFTKWQHILMVAAGPMMNFVLAAIFIAVQLFIVPQTTIPNDSLLMLFIGWGGIINIFWGLFNLIPVFPMDGGQIMHSFIRNPHTAHKTSFILALIMIGIGIKFNAIIAAMFFAFMAFQNYQMMNMIRRR